MQLLRYVCALWLIACCSHSPTVSGIEPDLFPKELTSFHPYSENPVFTAGDKSDWDARIRERGWILKTRDQWWLWYTGYDGQRSSLKSLGLATSKDGIHWQRSPQNPLTSDLWVEDMMVVENQGMFHMFAEGRGDQAQRLTSKDGIHWTSRGKLDVRMTDGKPISPGPFGTPTAYHENNTWYLFYERRDAGIWLATSEDMQVWTHLQDEPVILPGPELFDRDLIALNQIFKYQGRYYASLHGASTENDPRLWASGIAVSEDLIHWKKHPEPLRPISDNKSSGLFIQVGQKMRLYTMHDKVDLHIHDLKQ
ncbi:MAG: glycosylase [Planctomycetaceae bacterium]|nr:glycosylase [Planctomycetaceae bacterium]